jgi:hypothetical protein
MHEAQKKTTTKSIYAGGGGRAEGLKMGGGVIITGSEVQEKETEE